MFDSIKSAALGMAAAAALTVAAPAAQAATTTLVDGGVYTLPADGPQFSGVMDLSLACIPLTGAPCTTETMTGPAQISATFNVDPAYAGSGYGELALTNYHAGLFTGLTASWIDAATNTVLGSIALGVGNNTLATVFDAAHLSQKLVLSWDSLLAPATGSQSGLVPAVNINVAPVPLPAAGLMLVGALGGLAAVRRKQKAA